MKKKILSGFAILAIAVVAAFNVNVNMQEKGTSSILLENVEALAYSENNGGGYYVNPCGKHSGNECSTTKSPYTCTSKYPLGFLTKLFFNYFTALFPEKLVR